MAQDEEFKHESVQDAASVVRYLRALVDGFENGRLEFGADGRTIELRPQGLLDLEIRAKRKSGRVKVGLKFSWREDKEKDGAGGASAEPLTIRGA